MKAYTKETEKPFGYIILDNHPRTTSDRQVVADVFGDCYAYPHITKSSSPDTFLITKSPSPDASLPQSIATPDGIEQPMPSVKRKVDKPKPSVKRKVVSDNRRATKKQKKPTVKRKVESDNKRAKKSKTQSKSKPEYPIAKMRWKSFSETEQINSEEEEEEFYSEDDEEPRHFTQHELNTLARPRNGFGL